MIPYSQSLSELEWIPRLKLTALRRLEIETVEDLLTHYPRRYEDRTHFAAFPHEESETPILLCGEVAKTRVLRFGGWKKIFEATLEESEANALSQPLVLRWFNLHYVQKMIATGQRLVVFGKPRLRGKRLCMEHPDFEVIENDDEMSVHFRRITPIYPATEGLSQRVFRRMIFQALENLDPESVPTLLPKNANLGTREHALHEIHFPTTTSQRDAAREHLVFAEFFAMQLLIGSRRSDATLRAGQVHSARGELLEKFLRGLPFDLTAAQERVIEELRRDLASTHPMNRLLQGDVGSGKTVVAIAAILLAVESGSQAALMAPTQILAEQHYAVLCRWLEPLGVRLALRTGARQEESGTLFSLGSQENAPHIIVGTHALLYEGVSFENLGLAVIDEQHKFGVSQRARLTAREPAPDVLVMTATPIPRTLTMTVYGDLDVSVIDEMPADRGKIITAVPRCSSATSRSAVCDALSARWRARVAGRCSCLTRPWSSLLQKFVEAIEANETARQNFIITHRSLAPAFEDAIDPDAFRSLKFSVVQIRIVDHFTDFPHGLVVNGKAANQCLESAAVACNCNCNYRNTAFRICMKKTFTSIVIATGLALVCASPAFAKEEEEESLKASDVPAAVQKAADNEAKGGKIVRWEKEGKNFEAVIEKGGKQWGVGQWQNGQFVGIAPSDIPGAKPIIFPKPAW
jgi:ATP-dependent DNA helicase RecG